MDAFRWLHLTDLHWGLTGQKHLWPEIREEFFKDLGRLHAKTGPWDAVLFSGDLVQKGDPAEFKQLNESVLDPLWKRFSELGSQPVLLTVPGNHDLRRPATKDATLRLLMRPDGFAEVAEEFWNDRTSSYREMIATAFEPYRTWSDQRLYTHGHPIHPGELPGDFSTTFTTPGGRRIGIVGLNTTFLQLAPGDYRSRLACDVRQLQAACPPDGPAWVKEHTVCLLITHQGPDWLDAFTLKQQYPGINPAGRFAVHLFGHMHEEIIRGYSQRGGALVRHWQTTSLFGLEHYGDQQKQDRRHGYAAGTIEFEASGAATLRHWPRLAVHDEVNGWQFDRDTQGCILEEDGGTRPEEIISAPKPGKGGEPSPTVITEPPPEAVAAQLRANYAQHIRAEWDNRWSEVVKD